MPTIGFVNGTLGVDRLLMYGGDRSQSRTEWWSLLDLADGDGNVQFHFDLKEGQTIRVTAGKEI